MGEFTCGARYLGEMSKPQLFQWQSLHISEAEKSKTGYHNKLVTLVGLHYLQEWSLLEADLRRLRAFSPLQAQLQRLVMEYNRVGVKSLYDLGYLAPQQ